jgi:hypothetical protein
MPNYFAGFEIVSQTKNFLVTCANDAGARERARFVASICEADLTRLEGIFSTNFQTGETHDYSTWVNVLTPDPASGANGFNYGYESDQSSRIVILNSWDPPLLHHRCFPGTCRSPALTSIASTRISREESSPLSFPRS